MKYSTENSSQLFCEEVSTVTQLFEKWNDCERSVVMYALLKRLTFPSLKFLQFSIENILHQNFRFNNRLVLIEKKANDFQHLQKLISVYRSLPVPELSNIVDKDSIFYESNVYYNSADKNYCKKEDVLFDLLSMIPLLQPGNEDAKKSYLSLIPFAVEDTVREVVAAELVQQIFSYLLIHPAISNEDRRSLGYWLRHLEDHIESPCGFARRNFFILTNPGENLPTSLNTSDFSINGSNGKAWQTIAPPSNKQCDHYNSTQRLTNLSMSLHSSSTSSSEWNLKILQLPSSNSVGKIDPNHNSLGIVTLHKNENDTGVDDLHISFSKNGTEVLDCDDYLGDIDKLVGYETDQLFLNAGKIRNANMDLKVRRSNSLTTGQTLSENLTENKMDSPNSFNSIENLVEIIQKQRSHSLSVENIKKNLQSSLSETQLDYIKLKQFKFAKGDFGMSNIGPWLKSLRLHKYIDLFKNMTYETMLQISEDYLHEVGVTKGASHKLALCIERLKKRYDILSSLELKLLENKVTLSTVIEELASIVLTPMKPVDSFSKDNVARKFLNVLQTAIEIILSEGVLAKDEDLNYAIWIIDRALHNESFLTYNSKLKEYRFKLLNLSPKTVPKKHKGNNVSCSSKSRWNSSKGRKPESFSKIENYKKLCKDSYDQSNLNLVCLNVEDNMSKLFNSTQCYDKTPAPTKICQFHSTSNIAAMSTDHTANSQYKSASYPSFSSGFLLSGKLLNDDRKLPRNYNKLRKQKKSLANITVFSHLQNSLSKQHNEQKSLDIFVTNKLNDSPTSIAHSYVTSFSKSETENIFRNSAQMQIISPKKSSVKSNTSSEEDAIKLSSSKTNVPLIDINRSLEFLCLQMTEQAMN